MFKITNIKALTDELRCNQCGKLLSVLPVYCCSAVGSVCGRCVKSLDWMIVNGTLERSFAYESIAKYLIFPCANKDSGCTAKLKWDQVEEHEKGCMARDFVCPFDGNAGCTWKGGLPALADHLQVDHKSSHVAPASFVLHTAEDNEQIYLCAVAEQVFVALTKYVKETSKFYCVVMSTNREPENQFYRYQLEIGRKNDYFLILRKNYTEIFTNIADISNNYEKMITVDVASVTAMLNNPDGLIHCRVCVAKKNKKEITAVMEQLKPDEKTLDNLQLDKNSANHELPKNSQDPKPTEPARNPDPMKNLQPQPMKNPQPQAKHPQPLAKIPQFLMKNPQPQPSANSAENQPQANNPPKRKRPKKAKAASEVKPPTMGEASAPKPAPKILTGLDQQLLEELECPVCNNHMIPPIYICPTGHSICNECRPKVQQCPSCRLVIMATRNFTLEKLTAKVPYPCRFRDLGCPEILDSADITTHELVCAFTQNRCPLKTIVGCDSRSEIVNLIGHLREKHLSYMVEVNQEYARNLKAEITSSYYAAVYENEIFLVCCKHSATIGPVKFNVLHVGMKAEQPKYRFELQFVDQTRKGMKLIVNQLCQPMVQSPSAALKKCLTLPLELLEPFVTMQQQAPTLFFKFFIQRV